MKNENAEGYATLKKCIVLNENRIFTFTSYRNYTTQMVSSLYKNTGVCV